MRLNGDEKRPKVATKRALLVKRTKGVLDRELEGCIVPFRIKRSVDCFGLLCASFATELYLNECIQRVAALGIREEVSTADDLYMQKAIARRQKKSVIRSLALKPTAAGGNTAVAAGCVPVAAVAAPVAVGAV